MSKTWTGEAREDGKRDRLLTQLKVRFPDMSEKARQRVAEWPAERLDELGVAFVKAQSLRELGLED